MSIDKNISILIVEDNEQIRTLLHSVLSNVGLSNIVEAEDGLSAWQQLATHHFDIILTDWMMPKMSGLELLKKVRQSASKFKNIPILMITASDKSENIVEAAQHKINGYIVKPFSVKTIVSKIEEVLSNPL